MYIKLETLNTLTYFKLCVQLLQQITEKNF